MAEDRITPVILSGGSGTRLWPMSKLDRPKQFLPLVGEETMFEATLARCADRARFGPPIIVANLRHADLIEEQLAGAEATLILEPVARNTAPAIALAALTAAPDAHLLVMPSDHVIGKPDAFAAAVDTARAIVDGGWLVTFGIKPDGPETGYGYIAVGRALDAGVYSVQRFVEKPDRATAEAMVAAGDHVWNGGIFLFRADAYLNALERHAPAMLAAVRASLLAAVRDGVRVLPCAEAFAASPSDSIDYAVMERAQKVAVVPVAMGWSDVGSWDALHAIGADADGHAHASSNGGDVIAIDTHNCLLRSDGLRIAAIGVSDLIVVATGDTVMITRRGGSQDVKRIVELLKART